MSFHLRVLLLTVASLFFITINTFGQSQQSFVDSTFSAYMDSASVDLREHSYSDSLQKKYSDEFYQYFVQHSNTETGRQALWRAFLLWGNLGEAKKMDKAMTQLDYDSKIWRQIIIPISNGYHLSDQKTRKDYIDLLEKLKTNLVDPESKSEVLFALARHYNTKNNNKKVIELAREMIEINANDFYVEKALGFQHEAESLGIGVQAPNFRAKTIQGNKISLSDQKGKIVVLEFWATWCGPCMPDIPHLKSINSNYSENDVQIIGVSLDTDSEKLNRFVKEREINWPQILQSQRWDDEITQMYNVYVIPKSFVIGRDGKIVAKNIRGEELEKEIAKLVK
ncbi:TlpA disulfide reductase family protein [Fodinibius sp.]|uniref:peroxiredoxin family protein n=1 Tax=Fodinibius sp. TaxID=1872440 RepID=UPI002ACDD925|nr:TlpA disulfide reductase family protein [Fodinibius sp.]MDZ7657786.1 TlpA disulfide reductase family protein [Fodinibius sp.]